MYTDVQACRLYWLWLSRGKSGTCEPSFFFFFPNIRLLRDVLFATELARMTSKRSLSLSKKWIAYLVYSWAVREKIRVLYCCPLWLPPFFVSASSVKGNCKLFASSYDVRDLIFFSTQKIWSNQQFFPFFFYLSVYVRLAISSLLVFLMLYHLIRLANISCVFWMVLLRVAERSYFVYESYNSPLVNNKAPEEIK